VSRTDAQISTDFDRLVNMSAAELRAWLATDESKKVGFTYPGESESVGRQSARRIITILDGGKVRGSDEATRKHKRKVVGYIKRHLAQRPKGDVTDTRWRYSLMNWGHNPL
jgi:hypothetical protein